MEDEEGAYPFSVSGTFSGGIKNSSGSGGEMSSCPTTKQIDSNASAATTWAFMLAESQMFPVWAETVQTWS